MEIHPPTKPIESVKDFFLHLSIITIGILIALSLEQAVEAWEHHELAVQARENIIAEIRDNSRDLDITRAQVLKIEQQLRDNIKSVREVLDHKQSVFSARFSVATSSLNSTSWDTAAATGALRYMGYIEAKKFEETYELQAMLKRAQEDYVRTGGDSLGIVSVSALAPGEKPSADQLRLVEHDLLSFLARTIVWDKLASNLSQEYDRTLKGS